MRIFDLKANFFDKNFISWSKKAQIWLKNDLKKAVLIIHDVLIFFKNLGIRVSKFLLLCKNEIPISGRRGWYHFTRLQTDPKFSYVRNKRIPRKHSWFFMMCPDISFPKVGCSSIYISIIRRMRSPHGDPLAPPPPQGSENCWKTSENISD